MTMTYASAVPVVYPAANQYIASNSMENLTYNCTVDTDYTVRWEINRTQYKSGVMPSTITSAGISLVIVSLDLNDRVSQISFSNVTRWSLSLQCVAASSTNFDAVKGVEHMVVSFGKFNTQSCVHGILYECMFVGCSHVVLFYSCDTPLSPILG